MSEKRPIDLPAPPAMSDQARAGLHEEARAWWRAVDEKTASLDLYPRPTVRPTSLATKQVLVVRRDLRMRRGKEIAQGAHAASVWMARRIQHCVTTQTAPVLSEAERAWIFDELTTKIVLQTPNEDSLREVCAIAQAAGLRVELITDAGKTEFNGVPTATCCAIGPDACAVVDRATGAESELFRSGKLALY